MSTQVRNGLGFVTCAVIVLVVRALVMPTINIFQYDDYSNMFNGVAAILALLGLSLVAVGMFKPDPQ